MIIAKRKPLDEILSMLNGKKKVLMVGCGGCTSVCFAGGQREVESLLHVVRRECTVQETNGFTIERQCEVEFIEEIDDLVGSCDAIVSLGCGAGVQLVSERYPQIPVYPALNTVFIGVKRDVGWYEERCRACGDCQLAYTGGTCPRTRCAKALSNGPCGGTGEEAMCEVGDGTPCAWCEIIDRLRRQNRMEDILFVRPPASVVKEPGLQIIQDEFKSRVEK